MIKQPDIQRSGIEAFLSSSSTRWSFANNFLYNLCAENPKHNDADIIVGKLWIMFFIYDNLANEEIGRRVKLDRQRAVAHYSCDCDRWYTDFCIRVLELREFISNQFDTVLSPRELDNLLLS